MLEKHVRFPFINIEMLNSINTWEWMSCVPKSNRMFTYSCTALTYEDSTSVWALILMPMAVSSQEQNILFTENNEITTMNLTTHYIQCHQWYIIRNIKYISAFMFSEIIQQYFTLRVKDKTKFFQNFEMKCWRDDFPLYAKTMKLEISRLCGKDTDLRLCHFWPVLSSKPVPSHGIRKSYKLLFSRNFVLLLKTSSHTFGSVTTNANLVPIHILYIEPYFALAFSKYATTSERWRWKNIFSNDWECLLSCVYI